MSAAVRTTVQDLILAVAAKSSPVPPSGNVHAAVVNADATTVKVLKNGVALHSKIFYEPNSGVVSQSNPNGDLVRIYTPDGITVAADVQQFLNTLK